MYGIERKNCTIVPKKSPNKPKIPKLSTTKPMKDHFNKMSTIPRQKQNVPRSLLGLLKNAIVR